MSDEIKFNINITKRVVRVNPDGTRTVISETTSHNPELQPKKQLRRRFLWAFLAIGALQLVYGIWGAYSDGKSTAIILKDASCQVGAFTQQFASDGACRVESAVVMEKNWHSQRHGSPNYWLVTVTPNGDRTDTPLATKDDYTFWNRVRPTERIQQLRFVRGGYHRSGDILAFYDHHGTVLSRYNPLSGTHYNGLYVFLGGSIVLVCLMILFRRRVS